MSGPRAPHSLRHEPQTTPLKFEELIGRNRRREVVCKRSAVQSNCRGGAGLNTITGERHLKYDEVRASGPRSRTGRTEVVSC